jgi:hypothetical protein
LHRRRLRFGDTVEKKRQQGEKAGDRAGCADVEQLLFAANPRLDLDKGTRE